MPSPGVAGWLFLAIRARRGSSAFVQYLIIHLKLAHVAFSWEQLSVLQFPLIA